MSTDFQASAFQTSATDIGAAPSVLDSTVPSVMQQLPANPPPFQPITAPQCVVPPVTDLAALSGVKQSLHMANGSGDNTAAHNGQSTQNGNVSSSFQMNVS